MIYSIIVTIIALMLLFSAIYFYKEAKEAQKNFDDLKATADEAVKKLDKLKINADETVENSEMRRRECKLNDMTTINSLMIRIMAAKFYLHESKHVSSALKEARAILDDADPFERIEKKELDHLRDLLQNQTITADDINRAVLTRTCKTTPKEKDE